MRRRPVCWLLAFFCAFAPAFAQRKPDRNAPPAAPPPAVAREAAVKRGEAVVVPLGIHGVRGEQLEFLIRTQPKQGTLGEVQTTGKNSASVTYRAAADAIGNDKFFYAVRSSEGVSAPVAVTVRIVAPVMLPARLDAPESLNFPEVLAGERSTATFDLKNAGGSVAEGEVKVGAPWSLDGIARYRLAGGESVTLKLVFHPDKAGEFGGEAVMGPMPRRVMTLVGTARAAFAVSPEKIELAPARGTQTRRATLRIENRTAEPRKITLAAGPRLLVDKSVELPAKGGVDVALFADAADVTGFDDTLRVEAPGWNTTVPVTAKALGAMLKFIAEPAPFSTATAGVRAEGVAVIENSGGEPATVALRAGAPFEIAGATTTIGAKGKTEVRVAIPNPAPGRHTAELVAEHDGVATKLPLAIEIAAAAQPATVKPGPREEEPEARTTAAAPPPALGLPPPAGMQDFPNGRGNFARDIEPASAALEWPRDLGPVENLRVEERSLSLTPDGEMKITWAPVARAAIRAGSPMRADLPGLEPGRLHTMRVLAGTETIFTAQFATPAKPPLIDIGWRGGVLTLLFAALAALGWWRWKTRVRGGW